MPEALIAPVAGAVVGGLLSDNGGGSSQSATRDPWAPSQDWLKSILSQGQQLQRHYQANPFNSIQQNAYGNILGDADTYRNTVLPSIMGLANNYTSGANFYDRRTPFQKPVGFNMPTIPQGRSLLSAANPEVQNVIKQSNPYQNGTIAPQQTPIGGSGAANPYNAATEAFLRNNPNFRLGLDEKYYYGSEGA